MKQEDKSKVLVNEDCYSGGVSDFEKQEEGGMKVTFKKSGLKEDEEVLFETDEKEVNKYMLTETSGVSRSGSRSSISHHDNLLFLVRADGEWYYEVPSVVSPGRYGSDYVDTNVVGVRQKEIKNTRGPGRGGYSYIRRWKIEQDLLDEYKEVWLLEWRKEKGGSDNGEYYRIKNAKASRLLPE